MAQDLGLPLHGPDHGAGALDAFANTLVLEAIVKRLQETSGPTTLAMGAVTNGGILRRDGTTIVSSSAPKTEFGFRLTLETGVPISTSDQASKTTIYLTPYTSNAAWLEYSGVVRRYELAELSLALGTMTASRGYDVWLYATSATAAALEILVWTSATARATALARDNAGRWVKSGDTTRLYVGSFYSTSTTVTDDTAAKRFVWNFYNRVQRTFTSQDATGSFTQNTGGMSTLAAVNGGDADWKREFFRGLDEDPVSASGTVFVGSSTQVGVTFCLDSTTSQSTLASMGTVTSSGTGFSATGHFCGLLGLGYHYLQCSAATGASSTCYGTVGSNRACGVTGAALA